MAMHYFYERHSNLMSGFLDRILITEKDFWFFEIENLDNYQNNVLLLLYNKIFIALLHKNCVRKYKVYDESLYFNYFKTIYDTILILGG